MSSVELAYCKKCVSPNTRPGMNFDEQGVCSACRQYEQRSEVDWDARREEFKALLERYRSRDGSNYDCVVGVSGGKDSTYQLLTLCRMGLKPLAVTAVTCDVSPLGQKNLDNLSKLGFDRIEVATAKWVRAAMNRHALRTVGDISWPEHTSIYSAPLRVGVQMGIPLQVWGENPVNEFGGAKGAAQESRLTGEWFDAFSTPNGLSIQDFIGIDGITRQDLLTFMPPDPQAAENIDMTGVFLGYYIPWDGLRNMIISQGYGLATYGSAVEGDLLDCENLDNHQAGIHEYFMFLKFGFGRATTQANLLVRRGRISREEATDLVRIRDGQFPWTYLGKPLQAILDDIEMEMDEFMALCDKFTNRAIFKCDSQGNLIKDKTGNLTKILYA